MMTRTRAEMWLISAACCVALFACDSKGRSVAPEDEGRAEAVADAGARSEPAKGEGVGEGAGEAGATADAAGEPPPTDTEPAPASGLVTREGQLEYTELPRTKSVEAYMGVEFTLKGEGEPLVLAASETVSHDSLVARHGERVRVECTPKKPTPPDPNSSYPTDMDGKPLERPTKCVVSKLTAL